MSTVATAPAPALAPPRSPEPDSLYEVIGDQIVEKPPMGALESWISSRLQDLLAAFAGGRALGQVLHETLFDLRPAVNRERRPDLAFLSAERWPIDRRAPRVNAWRIVPDLAIEIVSPTNSHSEVLTKVDEYFLAGVRRVWVVNSDSNKIYDYASPTSVRIFAIGDVLDGAEVLPGFELPVEKLLGNAPEAE